MFTEYFKKEVYSKDSEIWRYMNFSKFVDLLDSSCLFFPRLAKLQELDPYEGSIGPFFLQGKPSESLKSSLKESDDTIRDDTFVSCWYLSDIESAALWRLFPKSDEGIAIKSTVGKLVQSAKHDGYTIYTGSVTYGHEKVIARKTKKPRSFTDLDVVFTKRPCFEHEKELRLAIFIRDIQGPVPLNGAGLKMGVYLESLISEIIISPNAPHWMKDLVERITRKYDLSFEIKQSTLNQLPY